VRPSLRASVAAAIGTVTSTEFAPYAWHDNVIHALRMRISHPEEGDWRSDLILDIDHIVAWPCSGERAFKVAPATLTFHDAGDLCISVDSGNSDGQVALYEWSIDHIAREIVPAQKVCLDRPFYRWRIELNWPKNGHISFAASGCTQTLRADPILSETIRLATALRLLTPTP
jgi:hypothetical protein